MKKNLPLTSEKKMNPFFSFKYKKIRVRVNHKIKNNQTQWHKPQRCMFSNLQIEFFISDLNDGQTNVEKESNENFNTSAIPENDEPLQELTTKSPTKKKTQSDNKSKDNSKDSFIPSYLDKTISSNKYGVKTVIPNPSRRDSTQRLFNILLSSSSSSKKRKNEDSDINVSTPNKKVNTTRAANASNSTDSEMSDFTGFTDTHSNDTEKSAEFIEYLAKNISPNEEKVVEDDSNIMSKVIPKETQKSCEETQKSCEMEKVTLLKETIDEIEFSLPHGWKKIGRKRKNKDHWDFYLISSDSKKFRSNAEVKRYIAKNPNVKCDLSVTNTQWSDTTKKQKNENSDINVSTPNKKVNSSRATNASNSTVSEMSDLPGITDTYSNDAEKSDEFIEFIELNEERVVEDDSNIMSKVTPKETQKSCEETQKSSEETQKSSEDPQKSSEETQKSSEEAQKSSKEAQESSKETQKSSEEIPGQEISGPYEVTEDSIEAAMLKIHDDKYDICLTPNNEKTKLDTNESSIDEVPTQSGSEYDKTVNQEPEKMTKNNDSSTSKEMAEKDQQSIEAVTIEEATSFFEPLPQEQNDLIPDQTNKPDKESSNSPSKSTDNMEAKSNSDPLVDSQKETTYSAESPNRNTKKRSDKKKEVNSKQSLNLKIRLTSPIKILPQEISENSIEITPTEVKSKKKRSHIKTPKNLHKKAKIPEWVTKKAQQVDTPENELIVEPIQEPINTNVNTENHSKLDKNQTKGAKLSNSKIQIQYQNMVEPIDEFGETNSNAEDPKDLITPANTTSNEDSDTFTKLLQKESNRSRLSIGEKLDVIDRFEKGEKKAHIAKDLGLNESSIRGIIRRKENLKKFKMKKTDAQTSSSEVSKNSDSANQKSMSTEVHIEKEDVSATKDIIPYLDRNDLKMGCLFDVLVVPIFDYQKTGPGKKVSSKVQENKKKGEKSIFL